MRYSRAVTTLLMLFWTALGSVCFAADGAYAVLPHSLVKRIPTVGPGVPIVVFNPLSWERTDYVDVDTPFPGSSSPVKITDSSGRICPARTLGDRLHFTAREVPALGYRVYWANRVLKPVSTSIRCTGEMLENEYYRVRVDKSRAVITGIFDKANSREILAAGASAALLQLVDGSQTKSVNEDSSAIMMDSGPARGVIMLDNSLGSHSLVQEVILHEGVPRVDLRLTSGWRAPSGSNGHQSLIKVSFPTSLSDASSESGGIEIVGGGSLLPGVRFASLSQGSYTVTMPADGVHSCQASGNLLTSVLRKQGDSGNGVWEAAYSIQASQGGSDAVKSLQRALEVAHPFIARVTNQHTGDLPRRGSVVSFERAGVLAVMAAKGNSVLRFFETAGSDALVSAHMLVPGLTLQPADHSGTALSATPPVTGPGFVFTPSPGTLTNYIFDWDK